MIFRVIGFFCLSFDFSSEGWTILDHHSNTSKTGRLLTTFQVKVSYKEMSKQNIITEGGCSTCTLIRPTKLCFEMFRQRVERE